jgi:hypothetical protein
MSKQAFDKIVHVQTTVIATMQIISKQSLEWQTLNRDVINFGG